MSDDAWAHDHWLDFDRNKDDLEMGNREADSLAWNPDLERLTACPRKLVESFGNLFENIVPDPQDPVWIWADMGEMLAREAEALSV